ncbi:PAS domain-containing protein (plasmid) [Rhizobium leguminosarum]|uniref:PAS domain-containing protein n=1 Tax=Rhizobium brockwellii TaxID=3019932 RepID=A0ABU3YXI9_9HYPH|nr:MULTISPECIES: PAS domain-containing protein [Rhizobium]MDV4183594.1 PAS domain-containing protein [Rhizobium brockwellii]MDV4190573.1 PAS domain-containing protein [Rhizobium brockwellii]NZD54753.1 PAS domain-containing protein [Rhizobium leguminosarum]QIO63446.1 PAS domain-containing protein [Rhizobium leguminosarum bv. trifolii]RWX24361.1 PAS domain-containing protein [Rhizobium leguminosarum]
MSPTRAMAFQTGNRDVMNADAFRCVALNCVIYVFIAVVRYFIFEQAPLASALGFSAWKTAMFLDEDHEANEAAELTKQTLVDTQERMGMMLDLMPMGFLIHTRQGIILGNQEAARLLQVPQDEVVGKHFLDFLTTHAGEAAKQIEEPFMAGLAWNQRRRRSERPRVRRGRSD